MASTYSTWEYYSAEYGGKLNEHTYGRLASVAAGEIDRRTFGNAKTAPASMTGKLCACECELVDAFYSFEESEKILPKGLNSMSNDGLSASTSYGSSKTDSREAAKETEIRVVCQRHLLWPKNLMYAGV